MSTHSIETPRGQVAVVFRWSAAWLLAGSPVDVDLRGGEVVLMRGGNDLARFPMPPNMTAGDTIVLHLPMTAN